MGCTPSTIQTPETQTSKDIDSSLKSYELENMLDFKILLLGAGESGKSTVVKQLKTLHKVQMDDLEIANYAINIHKNTLQCMQIILEGAESLDIPIHGEVAKQRAENVRAMILDGDQKKLPLSIADDIDYLWHDQDIQLVWGRRSEYWFLDATPYYFEHVHRFVEDDYVPTEEDCIMTRVRTTGISTTEFDEGQIHYRIVDVGGQRTERKKWIHCFDDVKALLFVVNLAGYDQVMFEDPTQNRMKESLDLFGQICNNPVFQETPIFLLLNKKDIFEQSIQTTDLRKCFSAYEGGGDVNLALKYIEDQYKARINDHNRTMHICHIAARFKKDVKYAWEEINAVLLDENKKTISYASKQQKKTKK